MKRVTYAVLWCRNDGPEFAGRLELVAGAVQLTGAAAGRTAQHDVPYRDLADVFVERSAPLKRSWAPALVLVTHEGDRVEIGSLQGLGALHEVAEKVADGCGNPAT
jgi:hypothetical protein